jgi:putative zinc finger/helix-turn-helix YgiT family protein
MLKHVCYQCACEQDAIVIKQRETFQVKGDPIKVVSDVLTCSVCHTELFSEELDSKNLERAYAEYRNKHNYLSPVQIKEIRSHFGSGRTVATLLGWSQATLVRYEGGAIPDASHHDQLLRLHDEPNYIKALIDQRGYKLKERERSKIKAAFNLTGFVDTPDPTEYLGTVFQPIYRDGITNVEFDFEKLTALVQCITWRQDLFKSKLQKLLFYADFLCYKRYGYQITGLAYIHHHYGPVPANHDLVQWALVTMGAIDVKPSEGPFGGELIISLGEPDRSLFNEEEIEVIDAVIDYFKDFTASKISEFSHGELGYSKTGFKDIISYSHASDLSLD